MKKQYKNKKTIEKLNRYFMISKIFFACMPVIGYLYVSLQASAMSVSIQTILEEMPNVTIVFLLAMLHAYIAYLLHIMQAKLEKQEYVFVYINLILLLIAEAITGNLFYFLILAWLLYYITKIHQIRILSIFKVCPIQKVFGFGGGSMFVIALSSLCAYATRLL